MKKNVYIFLSVILGFLLSVIIHAAIEIPLLLLFIRDFEKYGLGLGWDFWMTLHAIMTPLLAIAGIIFGYLIGKKWWHIIYIKKRRLKIKNNDK